MKTYSYESIKIAETRKPEKLRRTWQLRSRCSWSPKVTKLNLECIQILNFWSGKFGHQIQPAEYFFNFLLDFVFFQFFDFFDLFFCGKYFCIFNNSAKNMYVKFQINQKTFTHSNEFFSKIFLGKTAVCNLKNRDQFRNQPRTPKTPKIWYQMIRGCARTKIELPSHEKLLRKP